MSDLAIAVTVNGERYAAKVESRVSLCDFLRGDLGYTGVHAGCEHGVCGACTAIVDGCAARRWSTPYTMRCRRSGSLASTCR
jgi:carbon-monoxide dehydrogenase small subunit